MRPVTQCQRCQTVVREHDQLPSLITAGMLGQHLAFVQHSDFVTGWRGP